MRLLHTADLHGGLVGDSRTEPSTGLPSRLLDVARCWSSVAETAVEAAVDLVIVAGDTFHLPNPDAAALNLFAGPLSILEAAEIPTVVIAGNHDRSPHPGQQSVIELFHRPPLVHAVTRPAVVDAGGIRVACLPSVSRHQLMATRPALSPSEATAALTDGLVRALGDLRAQGADVLTAHWSVQGAVLGSERDIAIVGDAEPVLPLVELEGPWRYVALGHIHRAQQVGAFGWYAGSVDRMNFGEEKEEKLCLKVEWEEGRQTEVLQHPLPARRFLTFEVSNTETLPAITSGAFDWGPEVEEAIVRVRLAITEDAARDLDKAAIHRSLRAAGAHVARIQVEIMRQTRPRAEKVTEALSPTDALEEWFALKGVDEAERPALRDLAKELAATDLEPLRGAG